MKISQEKFQQLVKQGYNRIPVTQQIITDLDTPLSVYLKLADQPYTYLFESVRGGDKWGRYSFIGLPSHTILQVKNKQLSLYDNEKLVEQIHTDDPLSWIENYQKKFTAPQLENFPIFNGGLVGYFSYDTIRYIEPRLAHCNLPDSLDTHDILLMVSEEFIVFDTLLNKSYLMIFVDATQKNAWENGQHRLTKWLEKFHNTSVNSSVNVMPAHSLRSGQAPAGIQKNNKTEFLSNFQKNEFETKVKKAVQYMIAGDAMQISFSQRLSKPYHASPFNFYRALRSINPSPYLFYLNLKDFYIAGSSPEILVRLEGDEIALRPLAGTRPRGKTLQEDLALEKELLADTKELAEHLMLIDLGRNDVGRVSMTGSVEVTEKMLIERYSHVMHIVSNVIGKLKPGLTAMDVLRATFPAGTLTGTPKIRAMEIMDELENVKRGIYSGAVGYLAWNGNMDLAIAIRTAVIKDNMIHVQAGAGLVVDSIPENEWQETMNKARALLNAAELAERELII